jgi:hypothetical protein
VETGCPKDTDGQPQGEHNIRVAIVAVSGSRALGMALSYVAYSGASQEKMNQYLRKEGDMRTKRRVWLTGYCLLVAALGSQPVLGQEQPQKPTRESRAQADEELPLTRMVIDTER